MTSFAYIYPCRFTLLHLLPTVPKVLFPGIGKVTKSMGKKFVGNQVSGVEGQLMWKRQTRSGCLLYPSYYLNYREKPGRLFSPGLE